MPMGTHRNNQLTGNTRCLGKQHTCTLEIPGRTPSQTVESAICEWFILNNITQMRSAEKHCLDHSP